MVGDYFYVFHSQVMGHIVSLVLVASVGLARTHAAAVMCCHQAAIAPVRYSHWDAFQQLKTCFGL